jgi:hypothetical protein
MSEKMKEAHPERGGDWGEVMREPDEVAAMIRLKALGWGIGGSRGSSAAAT